MTRQSKTTTASSKTSTQLRPNLLFTYFPNADRLLLKDIFYNTPRIYNNYKNIYEIAIIKEKQPLQEPSLSNAKTNYSLSNIRAFFNIRLREQGKIHLQNLYI